MLSNLPRVSITPWLHAARLPFLKFTYLVYDLCTFTSRIREIFACGIQNPGIQNTALGIRNPTNDWHPESKFHWQTPGGSSWNPEYTAWNWWCDSSLCTDVPPPSEKIGGRTNMLARLLLASCLRCLANLHSFFLFYLFIFSICTFLFYPRHHDPPPPTNNPCMPTAHDI